jgi:hypothetical protein
MGRKRLQHVADTLCHMFCGWRLSDSYHDLEELGPGTLVIDALTGECRFNDRPVRALPIARELKAWLDQEFEEHGILRDQVSEAVVTADLVFGSVASHERTTDRIYFGRDGLPIEPDRYVCCDITCRGRVVGYGRTYTSEYRDREEWPPGWPVQR